jgi:hypothetical protein
MLVVAAQSEVEISRTDALPQRIDVRGWLGFSAPGSAHTSDCANRQDDDGEAE